MSQSFPPEEVIIEFLRNLKSTISGGEPVSLILRGSVLLRHWYGSCARPAADIDLECFNTGRDDRNTQRFTSVVDNARGLCCFATEGRHSYPAPTEEIEFEETDVPADGESLWSYGTPGERFYLGWVWQNREGQRGRLQLDLAESGAYKLNDIAIANVDLASVTSGVFSFPAYTPETMLAAKLSWLVRSLTRKLNDGCVGPPLWTGDPKDLFDIYLLLSKGNHHPDLFQKSLLAIGTYDKLDWNNLEAIFDVRRTRMTDDSFPNWPKFQEQHASLIACGPEEMLRTIADRLEPLLGDFYRREEMPFLLAINANPIDECTYLIYADWLEERGDARSDFLRLFVKIYFRQNEMTRKELARTKGRFEALLRMTSSPWLRQLFGKLPRFPQLGQVNLEAPL